MGYQNLGSQTLVIPSGGTANTTGFTVPIGTVIVGFLFPAMTGTSVKVQAATTLAGTYNDVYVGSTITGITVGASARHVGLTADYIEGLRTVNFLKIVSNGAEAADRTITVFYEAR